MYYGVIAPATPDGGNTISGLRLSVFNKYSTISSDLKSLITSNASDVVCYFMGDPCEMKSRVTDAVVVDEIYPTDTSGWFSGMEVLSTIDLTNLKTSNVTDMSRMFYDCRGLASLTLPSTFNTAKVVDMESMFSGVGCSSLDLRSFDTGKVSNMSNMFMGCSKLDYVDISSFSTPMLTNMESMFSGCELLKRIYASTSFTTEGVARALSEHSDATYGSNVFYGCVNINTTNLEQFPDQKQYPSDQTVNPDDISYRYACISYVVPDQSSGTSIPGYFTSKTSP